MTRTAAPVIRHTRRASPNGRETTTAIREAATRLFHAKGYEATSMRELAREVGIEAASLYNHYPSKHDLLAEILLGVMHELLDRMRAALAEVPDDDPAAQLRTAVTAYVLTHEDHLEAAAITDTERRSLDEPTGAALLELRRQLGAVIGDIVTRGAGSGAFKVADVPLATLSVLSICARLPVWYEPGGRLTLPEIADTLADLSLQMVGAQTAAS